MVPSKSSSYFIYITNLPSSIEESNFKDLLNSIIQTNLPSRVNYNIAEFSKEPVDESQVDSYGNSEDDPKVVAAVVELFDYYDCSNLINILNGYEWLHKILNVELINNVTDKSPMKTSFQNNSPYMYLQYPYYQMYPYFAPHYNHPYHANQPNLFGQQSLFTPPVSSSSLPPSLPLNPVMSPISHPLGGISPATSSRKSSFSTIELNKKKSIESPSEIFESDIVAENDADTEDTIQENAEENPVPDNDYILVKNDEDNEFIKVNPCRLFIGNVPYSSNWAALKHFLLSKSKEIDPTKNIGIIRVEIPMQTVAPRSKSDSYTFSNFNFEDANVSPSSSVSNEIGGSIPPPQTTINKSRGFAIVTTTDRESAVTLIEMFDNTDFEGRSLTVRFDKFPDYNNYIIQQLHAPTSHRNTVPRVNSMNISNLAFERNLFQQQLYYGNMLYPYYNSVYYGNSTPRPPQNRPYYDRKNSYTYNYTPKSYNYTNNNSNYNFSPNYENNGKVDEREPDINEKTPFDKEDLLFKKNQMGLNDDEKARDLVNSFTNLQLSSS